MSEREATKAYRIKVKTLQGNFLTFTVHKYDVDEAGFVCFVDEKTSVPKKFHGSNCEIDEVVE